jgi:hypothetical protein
MLNRHLFKKNKKLWSVHKNSPLPLKTLQQARVQPNLLLKQMQALRLHSLRNKIARPYQSAAISELTAAQHCFQCFSLKTAPEPFSKRFGFFTADQGNDSY